MANEIEIVVTATDRTNGFRGITASADRAGSSLKQRFADIGTVAGGFLVANLTAQLANFASQGFAWVWDGAQLFVDTQESLSKVNTVFGESAGHIREFAQGAAQNLGLSEKAALDTAGTFGNMFTQLEFGSREAAGMSEQMVTLAADFASFHNADITDVLEAQTAAFRGEYDAVQRFVPTINAAAVEQKALELGLADTTKELTAQDKALATYQILIEEAGHATGDFQRTIEGTANQQRIAAAEAENLQAAIGEKLAPVVARLTELKLQLITVIADRLLPAFDQFAAFVGDNLGPAMEWLGNNSEILTGILAGLGAILVAVIVPAMAALAVSVVTATAPFIAIGVAVGAVAAALVWAYQNVEPFREAVDRLGQIIADVATKAWDFIQGIDWSALQAKAEPVIDAVVAAFERFAEIVGEAINFVLDTIEQIDWQALFAEVEPVLEAVGRFFEALGPVVQDVMDRISQNIETAVTVITALWGEFGDEILATTEVLWSLVQTLFSTAMEVITAVIDAATALMEGDWQGFSDALMRITQALADGLVAILRAGFDIAVITVTTAIGLMNSALAAGADAMVSAMRSAMDSLLGAVRSAADAVVGVIRSMVTTILGLLGFRPTIDWSGLLSGLAGVVDGIAGQVNRVIDLVNRIPTVSVPSIGGGGGGGGSSFASTVGAAFRATAPRSGGTSGVIRSAGGGPLGSMLTMVADRGRELIDLPGGGSLLALPAGGRVQSNPATENTLAGGGHTYNTIIVEGSLLTESELDQRIRRVAAQGVRIGALDQLGGVR